MQIRAEEFCCPKCAGLLTEGINELHCIKCDTEYPIRDGILDFRCSRQDYYFNAISKHEMTKLIGELGTDNWPATIRAFVKRAKNPKSILDNLIVDGRYAWKVFLNLTPTTVMLDFGCGLGNLSKNLAPHVGKVYAMDLTYPRLQFAKKRFSLFNASNEIQLLAGGDSTFLPLPQQSIDCVTISGVFEWLGEAEEDFLKGTKLARLWRMLYWHFGKHSPRAIQLAFLKELRRVLKPNGQLFIAIENRLNHEYFTGRPDHHSGLLYGSLLPRFFANLYSIAKKRKPYRTYTYSCFGYARMLRQAGFQNVEFYGLSRGYSHLEEIIPPDTVSNWLPWKAAGFKEALKRSKHFAPAYGILASAVRKPWPRLEDSVVSDLEKQLNEKLGPGSLTTLKYLVSTKDKLLITGLWGNQNIIVRIPLNQAAISSERQNAHILNGLPANSTPRLSPLPLAKGDVVSLPYFVEERLPGTPLRDLLRNTGRTAFLSSISRLLDRLNPERPVVRELSGDLYETQVTRRLQRLFDVVDDVTQRQALTSYFRDRLYGIDVSIGLMHGDFSLSNLLVTDNETNTLIDWEAGSFEGLPIIDAISYLQSVHHLFHPDDRIAESIVALTSGTWEVPNETAFLRERYTACRIDSAHHDALVYLSWLHRVTFRLQFSLIYDPFAIDAYIFRVIEGLLRNVTQNSARDISLRPLSHA